MRCPGAVSHIAGLPDQFAAGVLPEHPQTCCQGFYDQRHEAYDHRDRLGKARRPLLNAASSPENDLLVRSSLRRCCVMSSPTTPHYVCLAIDRNAGHGRFSDLNGACRLHSDEKRIDRFLKVIDDVLDCVEGTDLRPRSLGYEARLRSSPLERLAED